MEESLSSGGSESGQHKPKRRKKLARVTTSAVPEVMDIKELSGYLGIGKSKIYALIRTKKIPVSQIGRQYRFYKTLIDKWLQEKAISGESTGLPLFDEKKEERG